MPGAVTALGIVFENEAKSGYSGGEAVTGQVLLELGRELPVKALRLLARGGASVSWKPRKGDEGSREPPGGEAECLNVERKLLGGQAGEDDLTLQAGKHEIQFCFQLPVGPLVTSFTGKYGEVYYHVTAVLERPLLPSQSVHRELRIIRHIDVNSPALLAPVQRSKEEMVGCWFITSGPVCLSAKIERKGYCNGEAIPIYAEIENCSSRLVVPKAAIYQTQTFFCDGKTRTFRQMLANVRGNHIASGCTEMWNGKTVKIPPVTPSILDCNTIRVEYSLAVSIHIPGAKKLMVELPFVIGTVPFNGFTYRNSSVASQFSMDMTWLALALPEQPEAPPNYADIVSEEEFGRHVTVLTEPGDLVEGLHYPLFAVVQEFRFQPPPLYAEVDPHPCHITERQAVPCTLQD
ncbi:arrestin domain-containing protein 4 [Ascaphus truei]|uniref:arrestin domain-containing protein 4 n=1 Tax=Ascaphus truei TaxID=8439 RepID=UPI003F597EF8